MKLNTLLSCLFLLCLCMTLISQQGDRKNDPQKDPIPADKIPPAPVLSVKEALKSFKIHDDFKLEVVASDPHIHDPVAIAFDGNARMWMVEMRNYMPDIDGKRENEPLGRISILEDTNGDGTCDSYKVFLDKLVMPRSIAIHKNGILYADQMKLYFIENKNDKAGKMTIIDPEYAKGGNVEHKANGLMLGLDNWYYNAKSHFRYREINGKWVKERTDAFRGQWGISQDNYGRLYYNSNSVMLNADDMRPNVLRRNKFFKPDETISHVIASNRVYPIRINPGVNRAYRRGTLDENGYLRNVTSACGPVVYRGDQYPQDYVGRVLVCEPSAHLVKLLDINETEQGRLSAKHTLDKKEFIASTDERFRPVNIFNAPDGTLYLVDFYRGIIQHKTYMTTYLRKQTLSRSLEKSPNLGRIYRIRYKTNTVSQAIKLQGKTSKELVTFLTHNNGWVRDTAQRLLVERADKKVISDLEAMASNTQYPLAQIHALWTLHGIDSVTLKAVQGALKSKDNNVVENAISVSEALGNSEGADTLVTYYTKLAESSKDVKIIRQLAASLGRFKGEAALKTLKAVLIAHHKTPYVKSAVISGLASREDDFLKVLGSDYNNNTFLFKLKSASKGVAGEKEVFPNGTSHRTSYVKGKQLYMTYCFACHNADGKGMPSIGPALRQSEWVKDDEVRLAKIMLQGLSGPITVNGKKFNENSTLTMPGLKQNTALKDKDLADIATYIRFAWGNKKDMVKPEVFEKVRKELGDRVATFTAKELNGK